MSAMQHYVDEVVARGELYLELERIRRLLVSAEIHRFPNREDQATNVQNLTRIFRALLLAKEIRQETIQNVGENHSRTS